MERQVPHSIDAERAVLGAMLLNADAIAQAVQTLGSVDFYRPAHQHVFDAVSGLFASGEPADPVTVAEELKRHNLLDPIGGAVGLVELQASAPSSANVAHYARIVEEAAIRRKLIAVGSDVSSLGYDGPGDVDKAVDQAETLVFAVAERRIRDSMMPMHQLIGPVLDRTEQLYENKGEITGTPTGFPDLDRLLGGLQPGALTVIGARPATGKTALALAITAHAAKTTPTLLFSLEMSHLELTQRLLCAASSVDSRRIRTGQLTDGDWSRISAGVGKLGEAQLWIDDNPNLTVMEIRAKARRLRSEVGSLGLVVVDYLQLMSGSRRVESRNLEVSEISRGLKVLARELDCPVVALSQLSRGVESRVDKRPTLADLRDSGAVEQDADVVAFIYRDALYDREKVDDGSTELIIAKHRNGPTGVVHLTFIPRFARFESAARP